jgi:hypothetical protein
MTGWDRRPPNLPSYANFSQTKPISPPTHTYLADVVAVAVAGTAAAFVAAVLAVVAAGIEVVVAGTVVA